MMLSTTVLVAVFSSIRFIYLGCFSSAFEFSHLRPRFVVTRPRNRIRRCNEVDDSSIALCMSGLFGEQPPLLEKKNGAMNSSNNKRNRQPSIEWQIYIDQSKSSLDRGASATLDAFCGLSPLTVQIIPAILPKSNKKTPWVRCISNVPGKKSLDVANVDSVDKVYRILTKHLQIRDVSRKTCDCLKWKYKGNNHLESGKISLAIDAYNKALLAIKGQASGGRYYSNNQEGVILLLRASAYLQQAQSHKQILQSYVQEWSLPEKNDLQALVFAASSSGGLERAGLANSILKKLEADGKRQQAELRKIQYRHGLYQYSLLHAAQDSLKATELLPKYSTSWLRAGELLSELWKLKESRQYYEKAMSLDDSLVDSLETILKGLERRQDLLDRARGIQDWPEDSLRLALDIAG